MRNVPRIRDVEAMLRVLRGLGASAEWRDDNEIVHLRRRRGPRGARRPRARRAHPRLVPARRPAAGALRARRHAAARRRRHRPPAPGPAPRRLPRAGRRLRARPRHRPLGAQRRAARRRGLHGRAVGHGDRERADGRGADARHDDHRQRRLRAPRPGPRADAGQDGRRHPRHRLQRADRQRQARARRLHARRRPRPHRDRLVHRPGRRDRRRAARSRAPSPRTCA